MVRRLKGRGKLQDRWYNLIWLLDLNTFWHLKDIVTNLSVIGAFCALSCKVRKGKYWIHLCPSFHPSVCPSDMNNVTVWHLYVINFGFVRGYMYQRYAKKLSLGIFLEINQIIITSHISGRGNIFCSVHLYVSVCTPQAELLNLQTSKLQWQKEIGNLLIAGKFLRKGFCDTLQCTINML